MIEVSRIMKGIYALRESDKKGGLFEPFFETGNLRWTLKMSEFDKLGLMLHHLEIKAKALSSLSLEKQAELLKNKITYLEEDFKLVEHDVDNKTMVLRSDLPHKTESAVSYYEVLLKDGNQLTFDRYEFDKSTGRRQARATNIARATFERLLSDFGSLFS